jgi:predicted TIM-barrel fold metal-dependent hydrolase
MVAEALQVADLARRFPAVKVVMTNGGQINISGLGQRNAWLALEALDNLFITTSGVYREDFLEEVVTNLGSHKLLFGSQAPIYDQDFELHRVLWAHVGEYIKERVLAGNALSVLARA